MMIAVGLIAMHRICLFCPNKLKAAEAAAFKGF
jgi:hypothetical protein